MYKRAVLPQAPKTYLRMVERDDAIDRLLSPHVHPARGYTLPSREFRIETTEERKDGETPAPPSPATASAPEAASKPVKRLAFAARPRASANAKNPE